MLSGTNRDMVLMVRKRLSIAMAMVVLISFVVLTPSTSAAAVTSASTDGEATVYITGDFSRDFDVAYNAVLREAPRNKGWSGVSLLLVGTVIPGPGVSIGLSTGDPSEHEIYAFTSVVDAHGHESYNNTPATCGAGCRIELRGTATSIDAVLNNRVISRWSRASMPLVNPSIQINAEVAKAGDTIHAVLTPVALTIGTRTLKSPTCAFTTQGVEPNGVGALTFSGAFRPGAQAAFVSLKTGHRGDKCGL